MLSIEIRDEHFRALTDETENSGASNAGSSACDYYDFVLESRDERARRVWDWHWLFAMQLVYH